MIFIGRRFSEQITQIVNTKLLLIQCFVFVTNDIRLDLWNEKQILINYEVWILINYLQKCLHGHHGIVVKKIVSTCFIANLSNNYYLKYEKKNRMEIRLKWQNNDFSQYPLKPSSSMSWVKLKWEQMKYISRIFLHSPLLKSFFVYNLQHFTNYGSTCDLNGFEWIKSERLK